MNDLARAFCGVIALALASCERSPDPAPSTPAPAADPQPEPAPSKPAPAKDPEPQPASEAATPAPPTVPPAAPGIVLRFDVDEIGGPAAGIETVVGDWMVAEHDGARGLMVDGSRWRSGTPSVSIVDQARRLYGQRYAEFLDGVKAFAFFPLAVVDELPPQGDLRMSVRFFPIAGRIDQAAGIAFDIQPDGSYACIRANALEDNILWARVKRGRRTIIDTIRNTPTPTRAWHTLVVTVRGQELDVELDGTPYFHKTLEQAPTGRVGLWSKADSQVLFDDFVVEALR